MNYNTCTLSNGLRVIHLPLASPVVYCGYGIAAGTRHEERGEEGLAHFCEHMTFKGTQRRSAVQIINALEGVGGELNAFTNKEDTVYYAAISREHFRRAVDVLTDIVFHSTYPQAEINKEVEVICDEIESYNDSPAELIFDEFENMLFEGHPLGHNILGAAQQLKTYTTADALRFTGRHYRPDRMVFFAYGNIDFDKLCRFLEERARKESAAPIDAIDTIDSIDSIVSIDTIDAKRTLPTHKTIERGTHQAHVMLGCRAYSVHHPQRMALFLLNNLLGGPGMNARLNMSLRERHGLVYTVESSMVNYGDTGLWCTYFGCDPADTNRCLRLVRRELNRLMEKPLSATQLAAAKRQIKGQLAIACDNHEQFALDFAKSYLHHGHERNIEDLFRKIDAISTTQLQQTANELFAEDNTATLIIQ